MAKQTKRKFKPGDVVVCVDSGAMEDCLTDGSLYVIKSNDKRPGDLAVYIQKDDRGEKGTLVLERRFVKATAEQISASLTDQAA